MQDNDDGFLPSHSILTETVEAPANCPKTRSFTAWWGEILQPYARSAQIFVCPSSRRQATVLSPESVWRDECPPPTGNGGGGHGGGGGGSGNSCPPPPPHVPNPLIYSYAFNAISEDDVFWSHSP
ncbi:hypothetical protein EON80_16805, partial [bacterium]